MEHDDLNITIDSFSNLGDICVNTISQEVHVNNGSGWRKHMKILKQFTDLFKKTGKEKNETLEKHRRDFEWMRVERKERIAREATKRTLNKMKIQNLKNSGQLNSNYIPNQNVLTGIGVSSSQPNKSAIHIDGSNDTVKIEADLLVNGRDILKEIDDMRDALLLLKRDVDMEAKYPRLKELKTEYEKELEKYKTFEALK